jgi:hypothetical protein
MWTYRANVNVRNLGAAGLRNSPGWSVGWFFVPVALFWKPYQAMKELWKASALPTDWQHQPRTSLLPWWWFFWISDILVGNISLRASLAAKTISTLTAATVISMVHGVLSIVAAILAASLVSQIHSMQLRNTYPSV